MKKTEKDIKTSIKLFEDFKVRTSWDREKETWYFSVVDIVGILSDSKNPNNYWKVLKNRLRKEGSQLVTSCNQLKMQSSDGKYYKTDVLDTEGVLRLVQSIPSPKAEPFKLWLAKVGRERLDEIQDPEIAINRALQYYLAKGYSPEWVNQRLKSIEIRKALTDEWKRSGVAFGTSFFLILNTQTRAASALRCSAFLIFPLMVLSMASTNSMRRSHLYSASWLLQKSRISRSRARDGS